MSSAVYISEPDIEWPAQFERERRRLADALPANVVLEHIGSTAVRGIAAKPTIDIMAGTLGPALDWTIPLVAELGYDYAPEWECALPDRRYFRRGAPPIFLYQLHVVQRGGPYWRRQLRFRDLLRAEPQLAAEYEALKRRLAKSCGDDREAYTSGKGEFVWAALREDARPNADPASAAAPQ